MPLFVIVSRRASSNTVRMVTIVKVLWMEPCGSGTYNQVGVGKHGTSVSRSTMCNGILIRRSTSWVSQCMSRTHRSSCGPVKLEVYASFNRIHFSVCSDAVF